MFVVLGSLHVLCVGCVCRVAWCCVVYCFVWYECDVCVHRSAVCALCVSHMMYVLCVMCVFGKCDGGDMCDVCVGCVV